MAEYFHSILTALCKNRLLNLSHFVVLYSCYVVGKDGSCVAVPG